jgi:hypothetical protein
MQAYCTLQMVREVTDSDGMEIFITWCPLMCTWLR